jgi:hypothetical protein
MSHAVAMKSYNKGAWRAALFAIVLAGCGVGTNAFINQVLLAVQSVCHAVIDDSNGAIEKIISGLPFGTTALGAAQFICAYIDAAPPLPQGALRATTKSGVNVPLPNGTYVVVNYTKAQ